MYSLYGVQIPPLEVSVKNTSPQEFYILEPDTVGVPIHSFIVQEKSQLLDEWVLIPAHTIYTHTFPKQEFKKCIKEIFPSITSSNKELHERFIYVYDSSSKKTYRIHLKGEKVKVYKSHIIDKDVDWIKTKDITVLETSRTDELDSISIQIN